MKYALVTGGSRGIGRAICLKLADMGYNILINYVSNESNAQEVNALVVSKGVHAEIMKFDVGNAQEVDKVLSKWIENNPTNTIEILVNNAGIRKDGLMMFMSDDDWNGVMNANAGGFFTAYSAGKWRYIFLALATDAHCFVHFPAKAVSRMNLLT